MSELSELLKQANREGLSVQKITDLIRGAGHEMGHDTVWRYMSGRHGRIVDDRYLQAFADVLPVRLTALRSAAAVPPDLGPYEPPVEANALDKAERKALDTLIRAIARGRGLAQVVEFPHHGLDADVDDFDVEAASHSPEKAGQPEPEQP